MMKETGYSSIIGKESDKQVQDYIIYMCSTGTTVNAAVVITGAEGITLLEDSGLLSRVKTVATYFITKNVLC